MQKSPFSQDYRTFLALLRTLREEAGLTQAELAAILGATQSFVSKCERGERRLDVVELRWWCRALGSTLPDFAVRFDALAGTGESHDVIPFDEEETGQTSKPAAAAGAEDL